MSKNSRKNFPSWRFSGGATLRLPLLGALLGSVMMANASNHVIQIDFGSAPSTPRPDPVAPNWNIISDSLPNGTTINLVDFNTGNSTGVSITRAGFGAPVGFPNNWLGDIDWVEYGAGVDGFSVYAGEEPDPNISNPPVWPSTATVTVNGLDDLSTYKVELVAGFQDAFFAGSDYQVDGEWADGTFNDPGAVGNIGMDWNPNLGTVTGDWMVWNDVVSSAGTIVIEVTPGEMNGFGLLNAMRITQTTVPEPGVVALLCMGIAGGLRRKRK